MKPECVWTWKPAPYVYYEISCPQNSYLIWHDEQKRRAEHYKFCPYCGGKIKEAK